MIQLFEQGRAASARRRLIDVALVGDLVGVDGRRLGHQQHALDALARSFRGCLNCGIEPQWRLFTDSSEYAGSIRHIYRKGMSRLDRVAFVYGVFLSEKRHDHPQSSLEPNLLSRAAGGSSYCLRRWRNR